MKITKKQLQEIVTQTLKESLSSSRKEDLWMLVNDWSADLIESLNAPIDGTPSQRKQRRRDMALKSLKQAIEEAYDIGFLSGKGSPDEVSLGNNMSQSDKLTWIEKLKNEED